MWKPEKRAPPPPEMPGLGTARLPLASKMDQASPRSSPSLKTSPPSSQVLQPAPDLPPYHTPPGLQLRPVTISPDTHMHDSGIEFIPMAISPHEIMHAATANYFHGPPPQIQDQDARPYSRAQSFDDFLRLHRLQDGEYPTHVSSAPLTTTNLPQVPHQHQQQPQMSGLEQISEPTHDSWVSYPYAQPFESYGPQGVNETNTAPPGHNMSHFPVVGEDFGYNDLTWQHFMNGLEL